MDADLYAADNLEFGLDRTDDESGDIILTITGDNNDTVKVNVGRFVDDAVQLQGALKTLAMEADKLVNRWEDRPEEYDGWVFEDRNGYGVKLEGVYKGVFPSQDIATYELARAMAEGGMFPGSWYENERGNTENIAEDVRKYHDEGGDKLLPLPGAEFEPGDVIRHPDRNRCDWPMEVDRDYGELGIWAHTSGDPSITQLIEDRDGWHIENDEDDEDD